MQITINQLSVNSRSLEPELIINTTIEYLNLKELPFSFHGVLTGAAGKHLGQLIEIASRRKQTRSLIPTNHAEFRLKSDNTWAKFNLDFSCRLSRRELDYIERSRFEHAKGNVEFGIELVAKYFSTTMASHSLNQQFDILKFYQEELTAHHTIPQSQWVQDFSEKLDNGKVLLVEYSRNQLSQLASALSDEAPGEIVDKVERSLEMLQYMEESLRNGNWKQVLRHAREFFELIRLLRSDESRETMLNYFEERNGSTVGFDELYKGVQFLHDYMSKFIHQKSREGTLHVKPMAHQEDAYFIYSICHSALYQ